MTEPNAQKPPVVPPVPPVPPAAPAQPKPAASGVAVPAYQLKYSDKQAMPTMLKLHQFKRQAGASKEELEVIEKAMADVKKWQEANKTLVK